MVFTGININRSWKSDPTVVWRIHSNLRCSNTWRANDASAHAVARAVAETGRIQPGTPELKQLSIK